MSSGNNYISGGNFSGNFNIGDRGTVNVTPPERDDGPPGGGAGELTVAVLVALDEEFRYLHPVLGRGSVVRPGRAGAANHVKLLEWHSDSVFLR